MRGLVTIAVVAVVLVGCNSDVSEPAPAPEETEIADERAPEQASIIRPELEEERAPIPLEPLRVTVPFSEGGSDLSDTAVGVLERLIETEQFRQAAQIVLRGHGDAGGSMEANERASRERAEAVAEWLVARNADEEKIEVIAFGAQNPIRPNLLPNGEPNERGRAANRRVEITILVPEGATMPDPGPAAPPLANDPPGTTTSSGGTAEPTASPAGRPTAAD